MDFKSLIKKFDTKPNNSKETIRFSTREPITTKNNIETQNEFKKADTPKNFEANSIMNQIYKSQDNEINYSLNKISIIFNKNKINIISKKLKFKLRI